MARRACAVWTVRCTASSCSFCWPLVVACTAAALCNACLRAACLRAAVRCGDGRPSWVGTPAKLAPSKATVVRTRRHHACGCKREIDVLHIRSDTTPGTAGGAATQAADKRGSSQRHGLVVPLSVDLRSEAGPSTACSAAREPLLGAAPGRGLARNQAAHASDN